MIRLVYCRTFGWENYDSPYLNEYDYERFDEKTEVLILEYEEERSLWNKICDYVKNVIN